MEKKSCGGIGKRREDRNEGEGEGTKGEWYTLFNTALRGYLGYPGTCQVKGGGMVSGIRRGAWVQVKDEDKGKEQGRGLGSWLGSGLGSRKGYRSSGQKYIEGSR
jgi:hypothetical protein